MKDARELAHALVGCAKGRLHSLDPVEHIDWCDSATKVIRAAQLDALEYALSAPPLAARERVRRRIDELARGGR